jgi:hypothetical protein
VDIGPTPSGISIDEWMAELETLSKEANGGFSSYDLALRCGHTQRWAATVIRKKLADGGLVYLGKQKRSNMIGVFFPVPVYGVSNAAHSKQANRKTR